MGPGSHAAATGRRRAGTGTVEPYVHPPPAAHMVGGRAREQPPDLAACYELCRRLHAAHGRTYYLATRLLPPERRPHVHALYGFARYADDLVDHAALDWTPAQRRDALRAWSAELLETLADDQHRPPRDPVLRAAAHTIATLGIEPRDVRAFLQSMAMDLTVSRYPTFDDLSAYVDGSGAAIGAMMLPVLGCDDPRARGPARSLGIAFQLTNFLRDVAEDWDRGRLYIPLADLDAHGVTEWDFHARHVGPRMRRLLACQAARAQGYYRHAEQGLALLPAASRRCVRLAYRLYHGILEEIAAADYQVFARRVAVPPRRRLAAVAAELVGVGRRGVAGPQPLGAAPAVAAQNPHPPNGRAE